MVLALNSERWTTLWHVYGPAGDVPHRLRALYRPTSDSQFETSLHKLMSAVYHQHDATTAAFAVAPHLERMMRQRPALRLVCVQAIALIEAARQNATRRGREVAVPEDLHDDYAATVARLPQMIAACADLAWEKHQCFLFAGTLLIIKGHVGWVEELGELGTFSGLNCPECGNFIDVPTRLQKPAADS